MIAMLWQDAMCHCKEPELQPVSGTTQQVPRRNGSSTPSQHHRDHYACPQHECISVSCRICCAKEDCLELVHARIGEQQGGVVHRDNRRRCPERMTMAHFKELQVYSASLCSAVVCRESNGTICQTMDTNRGSPGTATMLATPGASEETRKLENTPR
jgi:hypothetical protein